MSSSAMKCTHCDEYLDGHLGISGICEKVILLKAEVAALKDEKETLERLNARFIRVIVRARDILSI